MILQFNLQSNSDGSPCNGQCLPDTVKHETLMSPVLSGHCQCLLARKLEVI